MTGSGSGQISGELWCPTGNAGYNDAWLRFDDETGITGYQVYEMNGMKVLYGGDGESGSWLAIRAAATPSASTEQPNAVELPTDTQEIYISCFEEIAVPYTINWESLENLWSLDQRAFADSGLTGTMKLASAGGDPFIWRSAQDTAETPVETPDAAPDDSPPDDPPKLDITISDPSENEIPSISEPSADAPAEQPSAEPSAPSEQPSAPDTTTENTEPAADPTAAGEGETT